jgi:serine protease Do
MSAQRRRDLTRSVVVLALIGCSRSPQSSEAQASGIGPSTSTQVSASRHNAITAAVAKVAPTVVTVQTEVVERVPVSPFDFLFGGGQQQRTQAGLGTGFIVRSDGVIVTNAHVVAGAAKVSVMMRDGKVFPAVVKGQDETNDLAVLKIDASNLPVVKLGNSDDLLVGEWAIAIGNPYGFMLGNPEPSVSAGVVSALGRNLVAPNEGSAAYFDMIQTDAAINPGNSGGPLVDADGEIIGVNSSIYSSSGGSIGLGFAIPVNRVARVIDDLLTHGSLRRPWIGVHIQLPRTDNPRDVIALGAVVASVTPGSPAEKAGIQRGDMIMREGTRTVRNPFDWEAALLDLRVGQNAHLQVRRGSRGVDIDVQVADLPEVSAPKVQVMREIELVTMTPAIRSERGIRSENGALVYNVSARVSEQLGLSQGDVIVQINRTPIRTADDVARAMDAASGRLSRMLFEHQGRLYSQDFVIR